MPPPTDTEFENPENTEPKLDVVFVIDSQNPTNLTERMQAFEDVRNACGAVNANLHHVKFEKLDLSDEKVLEVMYNADLALIDLSIDIQKNALFYHLGVRESFGMKNNILTCNDVGTNEIQSKPPCTNFPVVNYSTLSHKIKSLLENMEIQSKVHLKAKFLADLRKTRESLRGEELSKALHAMMKRLLNDSNIISEEVVQNMLASFRDIQDYDAMLNLVDNLEFSKSIPNQNNWINNPTLKYLYAFALNRRKKEGDSEKALKIITTALQEKENHVPNMLCFCGRVYKDKFVESNCTDKESLEHAIHWYRKGFEVQPNEYAGINLATLLVVSGKDFSDCEELEHIGMMLNNLIGKLGILSCLTYWEVATFFEINVLAKNYGKVIQAAECMFKLQPQNWCLQSTMGNITLVKQCRKEDAQETPEQVIFRFWTEYFTEATKSEVDRNLIRIPILLLEPSGEFLPSFMNFSLEQKSLQISNICRNCLKRNCKLKHDWLLTSGMIKSVSLYKRDERCAFLYLHETSDDFLMYFPNSHFRQHFYNLVVKMKEDAAN